MSSASVTSSKREQTSTSEMALEIESIRSVNNTLKIYLERLRAYKKNLQAMDDNCKQLNKVNNQWVDMLNRMK